MGSEALIILTISGIIFSGGAILASKFLHPTSENKQKKEPYECGIPTVGSSNIQFRIGYYLFALAFLLFDVELIFLFPWAVVLKEIGMIAFIEMFIFLSVLFLGLLYAWKKGALKWV